MPLKIDCRADEYDKHEWDVNCLLFYKGKLYSGSDDGKVKVWSPDLQKLSEVQSNPCSVYCIAANENSLYSCSNEGTVKSFELDTLKQKGLLIQDPETEFWRVRYSDGCLYSGDHEGNIKVWKGEKSYGTLNVAEPVKDMIIYKNLLVTVHLDVVITELKLEGDNLQFGLKNSFSGNAPLTLIGDKYIAFTSREATDIIIHENVGPSFNNVTKFQGAHEKIINALAGATWNGQDIIFSGGWDKMIKKWVLEGKTLKLDSTIDVDIVVNTIEVGEQGEIYAGGDEGRIIRIHVE